MPITDPIIAATTMIAMMGLDGPPFAERSRERFPEMRPDGEAPAAGPGLGLGRAVPEDLVAVGEGQELRRRRKGEAFAHSVRRRRGRRERRELFFKIGATGSGEADANSWLGTEFGEFLWGCRGAEGKRRCETKEESLHFWRERERGERERVVGRFRA